MVDSFGKFYSQLLNQNGAQNDMGYSTDDSPMISGAGYAGNKRPKGYKYGQLQNYTPEQMQLFQQSMGRIGQGSYLDRLAGGDQSLYAEMEAPALRQFNELQGGLASRFSGAGMGARRSSGFQNTSTAAASNFAQELQSRRQELQRQALGDIMGYSNQLLSQRPYEQYLVKKEEKEIPAWNRYLGMISPMGGDIASGGRTNYMSDFMKGMSGAMGGG